MRSKPLSMLILAAFLLSCKGITFTNPESFGLRLVTVEIDPENYGLLNGQLLSKRSVPADIRISDEFKVHCDVSYAGRSSLDSYRKSYDLGLCDQKFKKRDEYRLSAQAVDQTMIRTLIGYDVFKAMGLDAPNAEPAAAYLNRRYLGLYIFMETVDKDFFKARKVETGEIYKARFGNAGFKQAFGSKLFEAFSYEGKGEDNYALLEALYKSLWLESTDEAFLAKVDPILDVDSFLSYMAVAIYIEHWDGFDNNYFLAYRKDRKKLVTVPWDLDRIWEKPDTYSPANLIERNALLVRMLKLPAQKRVFVEKLAKLSLDYPVDKLVAMVRKHEEIVKEAYGKDPILSRYQTTSFEGLVHNISAWDAKVKDYLAQNPP